MGRNRNEYLKMVSSEVKGPWFANARVRLAPVLYYFSISVWSRMVGSCGADSLEQSEKASNQEEHTLT